MTALSDLLAKVEAGDNTGVEKIAGNMASEARDRGSHFPSFDLVRAYYGSLDAARALHEAVLPGWHGSFDTDGFARVARGSRGVVTVMHTARIENMPARAWLIAILKALIAQEAGE